MWEQIRYNQTRTIMLLAGMGVLLLALCITITITFGAVFHSGTFESGVMGVMIASIIWLTASLFAYFHGDNVLLTLARARKINSSDYPRLYNIVEELKIASGLGKMPALYIIDDPAMNAFAIGCRPDKTAIVVTSGLMAKLNRDELQGVIGHEMAHIINRDVMLLSFCIMLVNTITIIVWAIGRGSIPRKDFAPQNRGFKIILLSPVFFIIIGAFYSFSEDPIGATLFFVLAFVILMPTTAYLIYYATSRRREYLADASSALYTRYPEGLASALERIAASTDQVLAANPATAPIYIINPFREQGKAASDITSTHPPISERIRILRAMAHASFVDYDRAYREVRGTDKGIIPTTALATASIVPMRPAITNDLDHIQRARETSNLIWNLNNYRTINCACGTKMRLPPGFKLPQVRCPHCGKIIPVTS